MYSELSLKQLVESCLHNKPEKRPEILSVCQDLKLIDAKLTNQASFEAVVQLKNNQMQELQHNVQAMAVNEQPEPLEKVSDLINVSVLTRRSSWYSFLVGSCTS